MKKCSNCNIEKEEIEFSKGRNQCKLCRSDVVKKYRKENSDKVKASKRKYIINNPEKSKMWAKKSISKNKSKVYERNKRYFENNKEKVKEYQKEYRKENSEKIKETNSQYYIDNSEHIKKANNQYKFNRKKVDPVFKLSHNIRTLIYQSITKCGFNKSSKTADTSSAKTEEEIIKLNHYTNLQPLCSYVNRHIKRNSHL